MIKQNRATTLLRTASKGAPFSAIAYFDDAAQQAGALVYKGTDESEYQASSTYDSFLTALETIGVKLKKGQTVVQLIGAMANKYLQSMSFEKVGI